MPDQDRARRHRSRAPLRALDRMLPLGVKIGVPILLVAAVVAAGTSVLLLRDARDRSIERYDVLARHAASMVEAEYAEGVRDPRAMSRFLAELQSSLPVIARIDLHRGDARGTPWASSRSAPAPPDHGVPPEEERFAGEDASGLRRVYRIGERRDAVVVLSLSTDELQEQLTRIRRDVGQVVLLGVLVGLLTAGGLFYALVLRRAGRLAHAATRVAEGDLSVRLPEGERAPGRDSLAWVGHEFDRMLRAVEARTRQQAAVAEFGHHALSGADIRSLVDEAVALVAESMGVAFATVFEVAEGGFVVRGGAGWPGDVVGRRVPPDSQPGHTLRSAAPVLSEDLSSEDRFPPAPLLLQHRIRASATVPIPGADGPYGVLAAHATRARTFTADDTHFLRSMANSLGAAIRQRLAQEELRRAEVRFRNLVERVPAVTYTAGFGAEGRWLYVAPQIEDVLGFTRREWIDDPGIWFRSIHPEDRPRVLADEEDSLRSTGHLAVEYRMTARDGRTVWIRDDAVVVRDDSGRPLYFQGVLYDITGRKEAEDALTRALEREREAVTRLRTVDEMKSAFLSAVSHELRTPLSSVLGYALTLRQDEVNLPLEERAAMLDRLAVNARKLQRLLDDLLDLDRLARGVIEPQRHPVDMDDLVRRVVAELELGTRAVEIETDPVIAEVDGSKVERILENLVVNAAKHTPREAPIEVAVRETDGGITIAVEDRGAGIPDDLKESVFRPFERGPDAPEHSPGTGVGLSIVARFAELHGGRAWIEDRPAGGASFRVFLPCLTARPARGRGRSTLARPTAP